MLGAWVKTPAFFVTPGTHSKWARVVDGVVQGFRTYMTGEMFALLCAHSVLARTLDMSAPLDASAFDKGVARALKGETLSHIVFGARAESLFGALTPQAAKSYLSGLVIGAELADALQSNDAPQIRLVGAEDILSLYQRALTLAGQTNVSAISGEDAAARGLWQIANEGTAA